MSTKLKHSGSEQSLVETLACMILTVENCSPDFNGFNVDDFCEFMEIPLFARNDQSVSSFIAQAVDLLEGL